MKFICGCDMPTVDRLIGDPQLTSLATCTYDEEGFLICMPHRQRRRGWRSLPVIRVGDVSRPDFHFAGMSELTIERITLFGEIPSSFDIPSIQVKKGQQDLRDNRDPEEVYSSIRRHTNGSRHRTMDEILRRADDGVVAWSGSDGVSLMEYQRRIASQ